jgi:hypothetical protein
MNESNAVPPHIAESWSSPVRPATAPPPDPTEQQPLDGFFAAVEAILRQPRRVVNHVRAHRTGPLIAALLVTAVVCSLVYGLVAGTFSGGTQYWAAPVKVATGLMLSALICLPSLYIFACLGGSPARLVEVFGLVAGLLALMTVLLLGFAPVAWVFSQSTESVPAMGALHLLFWMVATAFAIRFVAAGFTQLKIRSLAGINVWVIIFVLVMLQMTTALRPLVGTSDSFLPKEKKFFVTHWKDCLTSTQPQKTRD